MHTLTSETALTLIQALQLVGLVPCLFLILFLSSLAGRNREAIIPACYFAALACSFALPLVEVFFPYTKLRWLSGGLHFGESTLVAFSFLLILQFLMGRVPPLPYWLVLAIPVIGGGTLSYAAMVQTHDVCLRDASCPDISTIKALYNLFGSSMVFLLLIYYSSRLASVPNEEHKKHKYWLVVSLIMLHLLVLAVDLARMSGEVTQQDAFFIESVFRLTFIYLVITSLFRVFYPALAMQAVTLAEPVKYKPETDLPYVDSIKTLLDKDRVYREMRLNREGLAKKVGIGEHHLSRVINFHFGKNFNELINTYRIEEAKLRLKNEATQVTVIAFEVGFNSIASFNRVFKSKVGVSPTEYREKGTSNPS